MLSATPRLRTALLIPLAGTLTACVDGTMPVAPVAADRASHGRAVAPRSLLASAQLLASGLAGAQGSGIGPGGALYVTEGAVGRISRVDLRTGEVTTFASGLPPSIVGIGGVVDVAFIGATAYALVTLVGEDVGGTDHVGIYRVDGPSSFTLVADLGAYSIANPPSTDFFIPTGVQYSLDVFRGGLLVTDGHHNRVLHVTRDGAITEMIRFGNLVPTGLAVSGNTIFVAQAGPVPHLPQHGRVVSFEAGATSATTIASGARLMVDVEYGRGRTLLALSQGVWDGVAEGSPALPNTGSLVQVNADGTFTVIASGLDRPTSLELIGNTAYIVSLAGTVVMIDDVSKSPFGASR